MDLSGLGLNYLLAAFTILVGITIAFLARRLVKWLESKAGETDTQWDDILIAAIGTPVQFAIIVLSVYYGLTWFGVLPASMAWIYDPKFAIAFYIIISAWIISTLLHSIIHVYGRTFAEKSDTDMDDRLVDLLELVIRYVIWFAALCAILQVFEIDVTPLLAGAGIAGIAIALAAQDFISNFFGGAIITVDKPFKVGDRIKVDNYYGDVVSVGTRSTRIQTLDYQIVTMPNNKLTTNVIINYSEPEERLRITIPVTVAYGTDPKRVKTILLEIAKEAIRNSDYILENPGPSVYFTEFGESSLNFIIKIWMKKYNTPDDVKDDINCRISERFSTEGIEIPFPQMDIHMKKD